MKVCRKQERSSEKKVNYEKLQNGLWYWQEGKLKMLFPRKAERISFEFDGEKIQMQSVRNTLDAPEIEHAYLFLKVMLDGEAQLLKCYFSYYTSGSPPPGFSAYTEGNLTSGGLYHTPMTVGKVRREILVIQKPGEDVLEQYGINMKNRLTKYFSDCEDLVQRLEDDEIYKTDFHNIVNHYNLNCD